MKITDPEVIKNGEKDLIASVQEDLDPGTVREILKDRLATADVEPKGGQLVVHNNDVAFRLDFQVNLSGSLLFDRDGNLIEEVPPVDNGGASEPPAKAQVEPAEQDIMEPDSMEPDPEPSVAQDSSAQQPELEEEVQVPAPTDEGAEEMPEDMATDIEEDLTQDLADYELEDEAFEDDSLADEDLMTALDESSEEPHGPLDSDLDTDMDTVLESGLETDLTENLTKELEAESLSNDPPLAGESGDSGESGDLDEDINDLLKESREFWAQKKKP